MSRNWLWGWIVLSATLQSIAWPQTSGPAPVPRVPPRVAIAALPQPPVPADPLELVTSGAQPIQDATQRATIVNLLSNAHALSNVRAHPYDLKTTFTASGSSSSDGVWQLENISPGRGLYRWTASGPGYSVVNLYQNNLLYSSLPSGAMPLRLAQVRAAIFYVDTLFGPRASIRTAAVNFNGVELTCALVERMASPKTTTGGRRWDEQEFCIEPKSGLLTTWSPLPGLYISYDYSNAIHFHEKIIPGKFTITEAGRTVIEAQNESVTDPANANAPIFSSTGLNALGAGPMETPPSNFRSNSWTAPATSGAALALQIVALHGMESSDGHFSEIEVLATTDPNLNQQALDRIANFQNHPFTAADQQPGASPQSHEVYFTFQFAVPAS